LIQENVRSTAHRRCSTAKVVCPASLVTICTVSLRWTAAQPTNYPA